MVFFEKFSATPELEFSRNSEFAKGDIWKRALRKKQDCILLLPGDQTGILLARLHWPKKPVAESIEAPAGFLGLHGEAVYLDEVKPRKWWQRLFKN
jgi:hypothetical protein